jgi:hypothetical protein
MRWGVSGDLVLGVKEGKFIKKILGEKAKERKSMSRRAASFILPIDDRQKRKPCSNN